jgi:DNA repair photolyase
MMGERTMNIQRKAPKQLLTKASGYLNGYSHTLNPYTGCSFACSYCYVRRLPVSLFRQEEWGTWVDIKEDGTDILRKDLKRARKKNQPLTIFMSSSTDPYQPIEYKERLTRSLLEVLVDEPPDFLFVQTRSPLVTRDINLFVELKDRIRISVTVETDQENIRKAFTPSAPPISARLQALQTLSDAGIPVQAAISPLLPCSSDFPRKLSQVVNRVCLDDFFMGDGSGGKRTKALGIGQIYSELQLEEWYDPTRYLLFRQQLETMLPTDQILISQQGFLPG